MGGYEDAKKQAADDDEGVDGSTEYRREYVPWAVQPVENYGVTFPKNQSQAMTMPSTPEQVAAVSSGQYDLYNFRGIDKSKVTSFYALPVNEQAMFNNAAKAIHPLKTGSSYYEETVNASYDLSKVGVYRSPQQMAWEVLQAGGDGGSGGSGSGGGGGISEYRTIKAEEDVRALADDMAMEMIGRPVSDKEFAKLLKKTRKAEMGRPTVVNGGTTQQGLTEEGREQIMRKVLSKKPEWKDYQLSTTAMDAVLGVIKQDRAIAGE